MDQTPYPSLLAQPFTLAQAQLAGLTRSSLRMLCSQGTVRRVLRNVYAAAQLPDTIAFRAAALTLVVPSHVVICDRTAAWLHGVDMLEFEELSVLPRIETCVPPQNTRIRRPEAKGARRDLAPRDVESIHGLMVTTPLRTALDLGCSLRRTGALAALDWFLRIGDVTEADLRGELVRFRGRRGVVQLRELVPLANPLAESPGESWTRMIMHDAGLPEPKPQFKIYHLDGAVRFRLDLGYGLVKICVEYDGAQFHDPPEKQAQDEARRKWLRDHGWIVFVVRKEDMGALPSLLWTNKVRRALQARGLALAS